MYNIGEYTLFPNFNLLKCINNDKAPSHIFVLTVSFI